MTETEKSQLILTAYKKLKTSFEKFKKPNGEKDNPAKTCKDLYAAYPDFGSGKSIIFTTMTRLIKQFYFRRILD